MSEYILKFINEETDYYLVWSTVTDSPISYGTTKEEFIEYVQDNLGHGGMEMLLTAMEIADRRGISDEGMSVDKLIEYNAAGKNEEFLTKEEIIEYWIVKPRREGKVPRKAREGMVYLF